MEVIHKSIHTGTVQRITALFPSICSVSAWHTIRLKHFSFTHIKQNSNYCNILLMMIYVSKPKCQLTNRFMLTVGVAEQELLLLNFINILIDLYTQFRQC